MSQKYQLELLNVSPATGTHKASGILESYVDYAELCSDPEEVFSYMEDKRICVGVASFWQERAKLLCLMGHYRQAVTMLENSISKAIDYCSTAEEVTKFKCGIEQAMKEIEIELVAILLARSARKRSIEYFSALHGYQMSSPKKLGELTVFGSEVPQQNRLKQLLELCERDCKEYLSERFKDFQKTRKDKPRCSLRNDLQKSCGPKPLQRTHSILHQPAFDLSSLKVNEATSCVSPKSGAKFERKETMDSIEILKKKKHLTPPDTLPEEYYQAEPPLYLVCDSRMYRTTSFLDKKRVHFGNSNTRVKNTAGPKIERFRSMNLDRVEYRKCAVTEQDSKLIKKISSEDEESKSPDLSARKNA